LWHLVKGSNSRHVVGANERHHYKQRLSAGHGYGPGHKLILHKLQQAQARKRNQPGGYWIAEADPQAAQHAIVCRRPIEMRPWAVLATDGAYKTMAHLSLDTWPEIAKGSGDLAAILHQCQEWETVCDPDGQLLPRAKPHDHNGLAVTIFAD
jgi:hypothetical protein